MLGPDPKYEFVDSALGSPGLRPSPLASARGVEPFRSAQAPGTS